MSSDGARLRRLLATLSAEDAAGFGSDLHIGRKTFTLLHDLGMTDIAVDYVVVDTLASAGVDGC